MIENRQHSKNNYNEDKKMGSSVKIKKRGQYRLSNSRESQRSIEKLTRMGHLIVGRGRDKQ